MVGVNIYPKENDLPLPFTPTNICPLGCLDGVVNVDVDERERDPPQICFNMLSFRGKWNYICPNTFAPHVWHLRGKLGVNLLHFLFTHHPNSQTTN
jgi:hypothetical protein